MGAIYRIYFPTSGKFYVGQTKFEGWERCYKKRWSRAKWAYKKGKPTLMELALLKYGEGGVQFRTLMSNVSEKDIDSLERFFIKTYRSDTKDGYNIQSGGKTDRPVFDKEKHRRNSDPKHIYRWYHRQHGEVEGTVSYIGRVYSVNSGSLHLVKRGKSLSYRGWVCLTAPTIKGVVYAPFVWKHPVYGQYVGSISEFVCAWRDQKICRRLLSMLKLGIRPAHKGWTFVGVPTYEQEIAGRRFFADQAYCDPGARRTKGPRVLT